MNDYSASVPMHNSLNKSYDGLNFILKVERTKEPVKLNSQSKVCDATGAVSLDKDVLALKVPVSDGWFALCAVDLGVKVAQATRSRVGQFQQGMCVQGGELQVVIQRAVLMVICDEVHLRGGSCTIYISCYETCMVYKHT